MGFFDKVKQWLNIGGVKVKLDMDPHMVRSETNLKGKVILTSKSQREIISVTAKVEEKYTTGRGDNKKSRYYTLGEKVYTTPFTISAGEEKVLDVECDYNLLKSKNDMMKDTGGVVGAMGKVGSFLDNERSEYYFKVSVDVKGTGLDPSDSLRMKMIDS